VKSDELPFGSPIIGETNIEPIKNPVTGEEHRARIVLPDGFEYKEAEMGNTVFCRVGAGDGLAFELKNTYGQLTGATDEELSLNVGAVLSQQLGQHYMFCASDFVSNPIAKGR